MSHEPGTSFRKVSAASERRFGLVVGGLLSLVALWPLWHRQPVRFWLLVPALVLVTLGLLAPRLLRPANRLWFRLGLGLHKVVNPLVMGMLFYAAVVPMGFLLRKRGIDLLRLRRQPEAETYWIDCALKPPAAASLTKQF